MTYFNLNNNSIELFHPIKKELIRCVPTCCDWDRISLYLNHGNELFREIERIMEIDTDIAFLFAFEKCRGDLTVNMEIGSDGCILERDSVGTFLQVIDTMLINAFGYPKESEMTDEPQKTDMNHRLSGHVQLEFE